MKYSVIVVLANLMDRYGNLNKESSMRMDLAISEYYKRTAPLIVTSGWDYRKDSYIKIADAMKNYAIEKSIAAEDIITELHSRDTVGDAIFTKKNLALKNNWKKLLVITSDYHVQRTKEIFSFIYGKNYLIDVHGIFTNHPMSKEKSEKESLEAFKETFESVNAGNDSEIYQTLLKNHPFYNGKTYSKIEI